MKLFWACLAIATLSTGCGLSDSGTGNEDLDKVDLEIRDLAVSGVSDSSAVVSWKTTQDAVGTVLYGTDADLLASNARSNVGSEHSVELRTLDHDTQYWFQVSAGTPLGESVNSGLSSFRTLLSSDFADSTAPLIQNLRVVGITSNSATVLWETDDRSNCVLQYGTTQVYGAQVAEPFGSYQRSHSLVLTGLLDDTEYHYLVQASNRAAMLSLSRDMTFRTAELPSLSIEPSDMTVAANQEFQFYLVASGVSDVAGLEFTIRYSPSDQIQILDVREGDFYDQGGGFLFIKKEPGPNQNPIQYETTWEIQYENGVAVGTFADGRGEVAAIRARTGAGFEEIQIWVEAEPSTRMLDHNRETISFKTRPPAVVKKLGGQP